LAGTWLDHIIKKVFVIFNPFHEMEHFKFIT
jgi:hypothetical protein